MKLKVYFNKKKKKKKYIYIYIYIYIYEITTKRDTANEQSTMKIKQNSVFLSFTWSHELPASTNVLYPDI